MLQLQALKVTLVVAKEIAMVKIGKNPTVAIASLTRMRKGISALPLIFKF